MHPLPVTIVEHRVTWRGDFEVVESELWRVLQGAALRIDHIGSTAVPALPAKDIIDVQVTVGQLDSQLSAKLLAAGFTVHKEILRQDHVPPGFEAHAHDWTKFFFMQRPGTRRSNIHIRQAGRPNQRYALLVRDFLRAEAQVAQAYGELKKRLANALADPDTYPVVKDPVADIIYLAAERWAIASNWNPQSSSAA